MVLKGGIKLVTVVTSTLKMLMLFVSPESFLMSAIDVYYFTIVKYTAIPIFIPIMTARVSGIFTKVNCFCVMNCVASPMTPP
jgi:hypothetical protein